MQITNTISSVESIFGFIAGFFVMLIMIDSMVAKWMASVRRRGATQRDVEAQEEAQEGPVREDASRQGGPHQSGAGGPGVQTEVTARSAW